MVKLHLSAKTKDRLVWIMRPAVFLFFVSWTLNPYIVLNIHPPVSELIGFLFGCFLGVIFFYKDIYNHYVRLKEALFSEAKEDGYVLGEKCLELLLETPKKNDEK